MHSPLRHPGFALLAAAVAFAPAAGAVEKAGVSAAVRGDVTRMRAPVATPASVKSGDDVFMQDVLKSGDASSLQVLLLDETAFTMGPKSELVVDEFVYDPDASAGKMSARITQGVFRFVSGKLTSGQPENVKVGLGSSTLGIRGTMVAGRVDPVSGEVLVALLGEGRENDSGAPPGALQLCNAGHCVDVRRPGFGTRIEAPDQPPVEPFPVPAEELRDLTASVSDPAGALDARADKPTNAPDVAANGEGGDERSPGEVSGSDTASGAAAASEIKTVMAMSDSTTPAAQDERTFPEIVEATPELLRFTGEFARPTTYGELNGAALGSQEAVYRKSGLDLNDGGSYDFSLRLDLGSRTLALDVSNVQSPSLGIAGAGLSRTMGFGLDAEAVGFDQSGRFSGMKPGCDPGCNAFANGFVLNDNGRFADSLVQGVKIVPESVEGPATPVVTVPADYRVERSAP